MSNTRFEEYRIMWVLVLYDLPTLTAKDRKAAADFRKKILADGFSMFQFSMYVRVCSSDENANAHIRRVKALLPEYGNVGIMKVTDKQFAAMEIFCNREVTPPATAPQQLELF